MFFKSISIENFDCQELVHEPAVKNSLMESILSWTYPGYNYQSIKLRKALCRNLYLNLLETLQRNISDVKMVYMIGRGLYLREHYYQLNRLIYSEEIKNFDTVQVNDEMLLILLSNTLGIKIIVYDKQFKIYDSEGVIKKTIYLIYRETYRPLICNYRLELNKAERIDSSLINYSDWKALQDKLSTDLSFQVQTKIETLADKEKEEILTIYLLLMLKNIYSLNPHKLNFQNYELWKKLKYKLNQIRLPSSHYQKYYFYEADEDVPILTIKSLIYQDR